MMTNHDTNVLAIDGGGTYCRFALLRGTNKVMFTTASANTNTDLYGTVNTIINGLQGLSQRAEIPTNQLYETSAFVGLAGLVDDIAIQQLASLLPLQNAYYADDRPAALRGALGDDDGIIAHCGTGSFFAMQIDGKQKFAGGWGAKLGDEASAMWLGRRALSLVLQQHDGLYPSSRLVDELEQQFNTIRGILDFADHATPKEFGELAPKVTHYAQNNDLIALKIMQEGATLVSNGLDHLGWMAGMKICLTGGLGPLYQKYLPKQKQACLCTPKSDPLDGAIAFAQDNRREKAHGNS